MQGVSHGSAGIVLPCPSGIQGPGPGDKKERSGWAPRQRGGPGAAGAYLTPRVRGHQGWPEQGRGPQQQAGGGRCPHLPQRIADHEDLAEVELVCEPLAFGLVQDPLAVVIPAGPRVRTDSLPGGQTPIPVPSPGPQASRGRPSGPHTGRGGSQVGLRATVLPVELCASLT